MKNSILTKTLVVFIAVFASAFSASAQTDAQPFSKEELIEGVKQVNESGSSRSPLTDQVRKRGVDFKVTTEVSKELQNAGAWSSIIGAAMAGYKPRSSQKTSSKEKDSGGGEIPLGKYVCYAVAGGTRLDYMGYFTLEKGGKYQYLSNEKNRGSYKMTNAGIEFTDGPYEGVTGEAYVNNSGTRGIQITFHGGKLEGLKQNCGYAADKK